MELTVSLTAYKSAGNAPANVQGGTSTFYVGATVLDFHITAESDTDLTNSLLEKWNNVAGIKSVLRLEKRRALVVVSGETNRVNAFGSNDVMAVVDSLPTI